MTLITSRASCDAKKQSDPLSAMQLATLEGNRMVIEKVDTKMKSPSDNKILLGDNVTTALVTQLF